jgi:hypothetical protein
VKPLLTEFRRVIHVIAVNETKHGGPKFNYVSRGKGEVFHDRGFVHKRAGNCRFLQPVSLSKRSSCLDFFIAKSCHQCIRKMTVSTDNDTCELSIEVFELFEKFFGEMRQIDRQATSKDRIDIILRDASNFEKNNCNKPSQVALPLFGRLFQVRFGYRIFAGLN